MKVVIYKITEDTHPKNLKYILSLWKIGGMWDTRFLPLEKCQIKN